MSSNNELHLDIDPCDMTEVEAMYAKSIAELTARLVQVELEKTTADAVASKAISDLAKMQAEAGAPAAVTPGSGKKPNYTASHQARHDEVVLVTASALVELKKLQNNHDAIWWCAKHIEALGVGDKPDWHKSYKDWASPYKNDALDLYIPFVEGTPAAGSP